MMPTNIAELETLDYLEDIAEDYEDSTGYPPFNLSHWDPSKETMISLSADLVLPAPPPEVPYIYPYYVGVQEEIVKRVGFNNTDVGCLFAQAGTNATLFAFWWLKTLGIDHLLIFCPAYFPVFYAPQMVGIRHTKINLRRSSTGWHIPTEKIRAALGDSYSKTAIWITNPIYCTGVYFSDSDINFLNSVIQKGVRVVADECLAINGKELGPRVECREHFVGLYSPHKSVSVNAIKFAAIIYHNKYKKFFNHWADVILGGLSASSHSAIFHFLSDNFLHYQISFFDRILKFQKKIEEIIATKFSSIEIDKFFLGHFMMLYLPELSAEAGNDEKFMKSLIFDTGATLIPSTRNHFDPKNGFGFRINLARESPQFFSAFLRVCKFLTTKNYLD